MRILPRYREKASRDCKSEIGEKIVSEKIVVTIESLVGLFIPESSRLKVFTTDMKRIFIDLINIYPPMALYFEKNTHLIQDCLLSVLKRIWNIEVVFQGDNWRLNKDWAMEYVLRVFYVELCILLKEGFIENGKKSEKLKIIEEVFRDIVETPRNTTLSKEFIARVEIEMYAMRFSDDRDIMDILHVFRSLDDDVDTALFSKSAGKGNPRKASPVSMLGEGHVAWGETSLGVVGKQKPQYVAPYNDISNQALAAELNQDLSAQRHDWTSDQVATKLQKLRRYVSKVLGDTKVMMS